MRAQVQMMFPQDVTKAVASKGSDTTSSAEQSDTAVGGTVSGGGSGFGASGSFTASGYANWSKSSAEVNCAGGPSFPTWLHRHAMLGLARIARPCLCKVLTVIAVGPFGDWGMTSGVRCSKAGHH